MVRCLILCGWAILAFGQGVGSNDDADLSLGILPPKIPPHLAWSIALARFESVGEKLARDDRAAADEVLRLAEKDLPEPYKSIATQAIAKIDASAKLDEEDQHDGLADLVEFDRGPMRRYLHLARQAEICERLEAFAAASRLFREAIELLPEDPSFLAHRWAKVLYAMRVTPPEWRRVFPERLKDEFVYQVENDLFTWNGTDDSLRTFLWQLPLGRMTSMRHLAQIEPHLKSDAQRARFCEKRFRILGSLHDLSGQRVWEKTLLRNYPGEVDVCRQVIEHREPTWRFEEEGVATISREGMANFGVPHRYNISRYSDRVGRALLTEVSIRLNDDDLSGAKSHLQIALKEYPSMLASVELGFSLGNCFRVLGYREAAIAVLERRFAWDFAQVDLEPPHIPFRRGYEENERWLAAWDLVRCYEELGRYDDALRWAILLRDQYKFKESCIGGLAALYGRDVAAAIADFQCRTGQKEEAQKAIDRWLFEGGQPGCSHRWYALSARRIDDMLRRGERADVEFRLRAARQIEHTTWKVGFANEPNYYPPDFVASPGIQFAERHLQYLDSFKEKGLAALWQELQTHKFTVCDVFTFNEWKPNHGWHVIQILDSLDREFVAKFLREKLAKPGHDRAWACFLLARWKMGPEKEQIIAWMEALKPVVTDTGHYAHHGEAYDYAFALLETDSDAGIAYLLAKKRSDAPLIGRLYGVERDWTKLHRKEVWWRESSDAARW